ncbi:MAG TPA: peptidoglycan-binding domain-containing protein [Candidatus Saccharimonadales bacterium]|nr:peptidoglycan-binding domain-containing protein [Candidatus Saccharimonadales bacterium]
MLVATWFDKIMPRAKQKSTSQLFSRHKFSRPLIIASVIGLVLMMGLLYQQVFANAATVSAAFPYPGTDFACPFNYYFLNHVTYYYHPSVQLGSRGDCVKELQHLLNIQRGRVMIAESGNFDRSTQTLVKAFQAESGLSPDGKVNQQTWTKLHYRAGVVHTALPGSSR